MPESGNPFVSIARLAAAALSQGGRWDANSWMVLVMTAVLTRFDAVVVVLRLAVPGSLAPRIYYQKRHAALCICILCAV